jgi:hypothetical protein
VSRRTLALKREALTELRSEELAWINGGNGPTGPEPTPPVYAPKTLPLDDCFAISVKLGCGEVTYHCSATC